MDEREIIDTLKDMLQARVERDEPDSPCKLYATEEDALLAGQEKAEDLASFAKLTCDLGSDYGDSLPFLVFESDFIRNYPDKAWVIAIDVTEAIKDADGEPHYFMP